MSEDYFLFLSRADGFTALDEASRYMLAQHERAGNWAPKDLPALKRAAERLRRVIWEIENGEIEG